MSEHWFLIQEYCVMLNRPKQKDYDQFLEKGVSLNFQLMLESIRNVLLVELRLVDFRHSLTYENRQIINK